MFKSGLSPVSEVFIPFIGFAVMSYLWYLIYNLLGPLLFEYRFRYRCVDITIFGGRVVIWKINEIDSVSIINILNPINWFAHNPWLSLSLPNRLRLHLLVINKGIWTIFLTPDNIKTAIETISEI